jgi:hypothetical protein
MLTAYVREVFPITRPTESARPPRKKPARARVVARAA